MKGLHLSEHFVLAEFERSATAVGNHIDNRVTSQLTTWGLSTSETRNNKMALVI